MSDDLCAEVAEAQREHYATVHPPGSGKEMCTVECLADALAPLLDQRDVVKRVEALIADPWVARNWGMMARYQEGVTRRGAIKYGEFVSVEDLRAALVADSDRDEP